MLKRINLYLSYFLVSFCASTGYGAVIDWHPLAKMDKQIFPSYVIATALMKTEEENAFESEVEIREGNTWRYGDLYGVSVVNPAAGTEVEVRIHPNRVMEGSEFKTVLAQAGETYRIFPFIRYKHDELLKIMQMQPLNLTFELFVNEKSVGKKTEAVRLRSLMDCPFYYIDEETAEEYDLNMIFAAYVNENHRWNDDIRAEALQKKYVESFDGYQQGTEEAVLTQVFALWSVLQDRGMKYSSITTTPASSEYVFSQQVRLLDQSIQSTQANCVDGTVMFASLLREIDIEPVLVSLPDHMFLGFYVDAELSQLVFLETTLIGSLETTDHENFEARWALFEEAMEEGEAQVKEHEAKFAAEDEPDYQIIPVYVAREMGITPIAFTN